MYSICLVRRYANNLLIDLTKLSAFRLDNNKIYFYNHTPNYGGSLIFGFGFGMTSTKNIFETIQWKTNEDALDEFNSIQKDLNIYYERIGLVNKI